MKTAIFVRGHARTWSLTKKHNLTLLDDIYESPDWFFAAPASGTLGNASIKDDFSGHNLISALLLDENSYPLSIKTLNVNSWRFWTPAYWRLAWLDYHLGRVKRQHELATGIRYDNVLFIRPDCWYYRVGQDERATKLLHSMSVSHIGQNGAMLFDDWVSDDLFWRAGASAADILCLRWFDTHYDRNAHNQLIHGNSHALLALYVARNLISHDPYTNSFKCTLMRPDHSDHMPWTVEKNDETHNDSKKWHDITNDEKIVWCQKLGIDPRDYQLVD
jgi:hypothetical protein